MTPPVKRPLDERPRLGGSASRSVVLILVTVLAYLPALRAEFIWDDDNYVEHNSALRSADGLYRIWFEPGATPQFYPLVFTSFWVEYRAWGLDPAGYHAVNVLLHALNALLLWRALERLAVPGAWWAAAVFALHPVHVESVAWISERKNVLSGFFYLGALLAYWRFDPPGPETDARAGGWTWYALSLFFFVGALLSKTVTCTLPAVLLLVLWWRRGAVRRRDVWAVAPMAVLGAGLAAVTVWVEKAYVGAQGPAWHLTASVRILVAGRALWFYAGKLAWPVQLTFVYPRWEIEAGEWWQWLFPLAAGGVAALLWLARTRFGRGPFVGFLFFAGTLLPALGFFDLYPMRYSFVADHFQYLASIGLLALAVGLFVSKIRTSQRTTWVACPVLGGAVLAALGVLTFRQSLHYRDRESLWNDTIAKNPGCWMARYNLGKLYLERGRVEDARAQLAAAVACKPDWADGHGEWGLACAEAGDYMEAMGHFAEALRLDPRQENTLLNVGVVLARQGHFNDALRRFDELLFIYPRSAPGYYNRGLTLTRLGRRDEAVDSFRRAVAIRPRDVSYRLELAQSLRDAGRFAEAEIEYTEARRLSDGSEGTGGR
jgi:tetratricopeptide (TPR) repeat protein